MSSESFESSFVSPFSGTVFEYTLEDEEDINSIEEIAHGLAGINRYNALTDPYVNVAQHSFYTMKLNEEKGHSPRTLLHTLLHDAEEIRTGDLPHPLKEVRIDNTELKPFVNLESLDRGYIREQVDETSFNLSDYTKEELFDIFHGIAGGINVQLGDVMDTIDEKAEKSLYNDIKVERPSEAQEDMVKEADVEATAYEVEYLFSDEIAETLIEEWEDSYSERIQEYRKNITEKPDYMNFSEPAETSKKNFLNAFHDQMAKVR